MKHLALRRWVFGGDLTVGYQMFKLVLGATTTSTCPSALLWNTVLTHVILHSSGSPPTLTEPPLSDAPLQGVSIGTSSEFGRVRD